MVLFGVYEWTQPQLKKVYPTDSVFDTAFGLLKPQFLQIWGRTNPTYVSMHIYTNMYIYIYTYILSICIYLSMCIVGSTHLKISKLWVKWSSSYHVESVAPASTASTNGVPFPFIIGLHIPWISQWGYISTIVRPNIYWIYTYIYISIPMDHDLGLSRHSQPQISFCGSLA